MSVVRAEQKLAPRLRRNGVLPYIVRLERTAVPGEVEAALRLAGVQVLRRGSQLLVIADSTELDRLADIDGVATIENFALRIKHNEFGGGTIMGSALANASGFDGSTQTIAIADTGLGVGTAAGAHADIPAARVGSIFNWPGVPDFCFETIANDGAQDVDSGHGTHVATAALGAGNASGRRPRHCAGRQPGLPGNRKLRGAVAALQPALRLARRRITWSGFPTTSATSSTRPTSRTRACIRTRGAPRSRARIPPTAPTPMRSSGRIATWP